MIEASVRAVPGLVPVFLVLAAVVGAGAVKFARVKCLPVVPAALSAVSLIGALVVTLLPGEAGDAVTELTCNAGMPLGDVLGTSSGRLNLLLFLPFCFFGVLSARRPVGVLGCGIALVFTVELFQAVFALGRSCSYSDIKANASGVVIGTILGTIWVWVGTRKVPFGRRDGMVGAGVLVVSSCVAFAVFGFWITINKVDTESIGVTADQGRWARSVAEKIDGPGVKVVQMQLRKETSGPSSVIYLTTDKSRLMLLWPDRKIQLLFENANQDDYGSLGKSDIRQAGEDFARKWYPDEVAGSKETLDLVGKGSGPYVLSYRRYADKVMMPMRLDITVSSAGRIMAANCRPTRDPELPAVKIDKKSAQERAVRNSGSKAAGSTFLIAQEVNAVWRPVWLVNLIKQGEQEPSGAVAFIDAVTGRQVVGDQQGSGWSMGS
ncbi:VanZ family protein [Streptomyces sp. NPDC005435]|uniref:VanZ family protein n=1 Tax=Streptomyces sp. NPDC005435 TaxID=3154464 RepID=UPI0034512220